MNNITENKIEIAIDDDGVGINEEKLEKILSINESEHSHKGLNSIGLKNVNDRIKLTYGQEFGLKIESKINVRTKIIIQLPKEL
jgi:two-component system sensor histidine kinase YesM